MVTEVDNLACGVLVAPHASADQRDVLAESNVDPLDDAAIGQLKVNHVALPALRGDRCQLVANGLREPPRGSGQGKEDHAGQQDGNEHDQGEGKHAVIMGYPVEEWDSVMPMLVASYRALTNSLVHAPTG